MFHIGIPEGFMLTVYSSRVIVYAMINYDIYTNEMLGHHQPTSNKTKHQITVLQAELLKVNR